MEGLQASINGFFGTLAGWAVLIIIGSVLQKIGFWEFVFKILTFWKR